MTRPILATLIGLAGAFGAFGSLVPSAHAEPETRDAEVRRGLAEDARQYTVRPAGFGWSLFARAEAGADIGVEERTAASVEHLAAGAEIRLTGDLCDPFAIGGQGHLWRERGVGAASGEQWASACIFKGGRVFEAELDHHLEWDVLPALSARRYLHPDRNRRETLRLSLDSVRFPLSFWAPEAARDGSVAPDDDLLLFAFDLTGSFLWTTSDRAVAAHTTFDFAAARFVRPRPAEPGEFGDRDIQIDVLGAVSQMMSESNVIEIDIARARNLPLAGRAIALGGHAGIAWGQGGPFVSEFDRQIEFYAPVGAVTLDAGPFGDSGARLGARAEQAAWPMFDGSLVRERRMSAHASATVAGNRFALTGFVADTEVHTPAMDAAEQPGDQPGDSIPPIPGAEQVSSAMTGGGSLQVTRSIAHGLGLHVTAEAARSFYARRGGELPTEPEWALRITAGVGVTFGSPAAR